QQPARADDRGHPPVAVGEPRALAAYPGGDGELVRWPPQDRPGDRPARRARCASCDAQPRSRGGVDHRRLEPKPLRRLTAQLAGPPLVIDAAAPAFRRRWREWRAGGATGVLATVALEEGTGLALARLGDWLRWVRSEPDELRLALTTADLVDA